MMKWFDAIKGKRVVFLTTKNLDYLRNVQEIELIREYALEMQVIGSMNKSYIRRVLKVYSTFLRTRSNTYDVIFCGFAPQIMYPILKMRKSEMLIMDFFISCYDTLVFDRRKFKAGSLVARMLKRLDRKTLELADMVIGDTKAHCAYFSEEFGIPSSLFQVQYLKADTSIYYPREKNRADRADSEQKTVLYFGSVLPLQGVEVVLEATHLLPDVKFIIIGPVKDIDMKSMQNVEFIPWLSQHDLAEAISEADLCLAGHFHKDIMKAKRTIPGKAYIYEAMKKPMILGDNAATRELYDESQEGIYFVEMGSPEALANKIREGIGKS